MISVAMATCQGGARVGPQLASILSELSMDDQVVVADASSTDDTLDVVRSFADPRVEIVPGLPRGRIPDTFAAALRSCRGDTIFLSDQDDLWLAGKVDACLRALDASGALLVVHDAVVVDGLGNVLAPSFSRARGFRPGFWRNLWRPGYLGCATALRRELLEVALPFPPDLPMHDWWLGLLAERTGKVAYLDQPFLHHVRHGANANFSPRSSPYGPLRRLAFRWTILQAVRRRLAQRPHGNLAG
ncbi:MAG TPA: glycosyltransferase [Fibrobacteria bacterium]|nr:glycosyltransferase [Fibrobacteria bacterium]